jgi:hypothetical protein
MILVANTQTGVCHLIAEDRLEEYAASWWQGTSDDLLSHGVNEGWAKLADEQGNPL